MAWPNLRRLITRLSKRILVSLYTFAKEKQALVLLTGACFSVLKLSVAAGAQSCDIMIKRFCQNQIQFACRDVENQDGSVFCYLRPFD